LGTQITLELAEMTLTYSKNHMGQDHGCLYQEGDRKRLRSDQVDYDYFEKTKEDPALMEMAFARKLKDILPRLNLIGFTREQAKFSYEAAIERDREYTSYDDDEATPARDLMSFDEFCAFVAAHPVETLDNVYDGKKSDEKIKGRFANDPALERIPGSSYAHRNAYSERSFFGELIGAIDPYSLLQVLADNPENSEADVVWQHGPLVEAGWAEDVEFFPCARRTQTFLIATEGSSDVHILNYALQVLRPDVADFFRFIDVSESHPFSGTGSLVKFAEGLTKIDVQNQVVFVFDNDAEGYEACQKVKRFTLPPNMRAIILPEMEVFRAFPARGPNGIADADINKRAAAIECYLDLSFIKEPQPHVVWTNYKKEADVYQGALDNKEAHYKAFLKKAAPAIANGTYDTSKLRAVLESLITECSSIAQGQLHTNNSGLW